MNTVKTHIILAISIVTFSAAEPTKYGESIGCNGKTTAYSNKDNTYVSNDSHFIILHNQSLCSGMKWQCVEYARRWLMENRDIFFGDVQYATDIWALSSAKQLSDNTNPLTALRYINGVSTEKPRVGDLLIYDTSYAPVTGHVSVIVAVGTDTIKVAEQNYSSYKWAAPDYSQELKLILKTEERGDSQYGIQDKGVIGWMRFIL